jgi:hypothetical protein
MAKKQSNIAEFQRDECTNISNDEAGEEYVDVIVRS